MQAKADPLPLPFWLQWLLAAMIAGMITRAAHPKTLVITGLIFGLSQWVVLLPVLRPRTWFAHALWLPASALSGLIAYLLIASLGVRLLGPVLIAVAAPYEDFASHLIFVTMLWSIIGLGQWPLLRGVLPGAGCWILTSAGGGALGAIIDLAILAAGGEVYDSIWAGLLAGGGYGAVTARTIVHIKDAN